MSLARIRCPQCGKMSEYRTDNPSRPFCSERCKLIDLGAWAEERYSIPGPVVEGDLDHPHSDKEEGDYLDNPSPATVGRRRLDA